MTDFTPAQKLAALRSMRDSAGWTIWSEILRGDILNAACQMADSPTMSEAEMHFRRGSISTARSHLAALDLLIQQFENDALLAHADAQRRTPDYTPNAL